MPIKLREIPASVDKRLGGCPPSGQPKLPPGNRVLLVLLAVLSGCRCQETLSPADTLAPVARPRSVVRPPRSLRLLTYNVLADATVARQRVPGLLAIIGQAKADIIGLQEVAPWFLRELRRQPWIERYHLSRCGGRVAPGGQLVLTRFPIRGAICEVLPGPQRRVVVLARVALPGRMVAVATVHLESYLEDGPVRAKQLDRTFELLKPYPDAVLLGDFNFGDREQPETDRLDPGYTDPWRALHPDRPGFTWNIEKSEMARKGSFVNEPSRRLDRILVRIRGYSPRNIRIIGAAPAPGARPGVFPSDHFGLVAEIARR